MPKVLIREYDNSTTGLPASDNFAVVVPGFFGIHTGDEKEVLIDQDVYELKSQADFTKYIGESKGEQVQSIGPNLREINPSPTNNYDKYYRHLRVADFYRVDEVTNLPLNVYRIDELPEGDPSNGLNGYLLKTINYDYIPTDVDGESLYDENSTEAIKITKSVTIKLTKVKMEDVDFTRDEEKGYSYTSSNKYCLVKEGDEGKDEFVVTQNGNQIAYELLGLGYTVLFKKLNTVDDLRNATFWTPLKDKSVFNFRYVMTGGYYDVEAMNQIIALAEFNNEVKLEDADTLNNECGRGDCIALCDIDEDGYNVDPASSTSLIVSNIGAAAKAITASPYAAIFAPRVTYVKSQKYLDTWGNATFPASFHYLACAARAFKNYAEWYAVAGYNRGLSDLAISHTSVKLGEIAINTLAPRILNKYTNKSINLILHEKGNYFLWGNRTAKELNTNGILFHHFLNIRQLCCSIKKQLYTACRQFTFDPNSDLLWINFCNAIKPTLEAMRADQGIKGYKITKVLNDKKALLTANIRIVPIEAIEDFDISIYLEDSLTGIVINANEVEAE